MAKQEQKPAHGQATENGNSTLKYRYNESMINWEQLKDFGVSREYLQEKGLLDGMLKGYKTNALVPVSMNFGSAVLRTDARLSFQQSAGGPVVLAMHDKGFYLQILFYQFDIPQYSNEFYIMRLLWLLPTPSC